MTWGSFSTTQIQFCPSLLKTLPGGGGFKREGTHIFLWLIHVDIWQTPISYFKATILQLKINNCFSIQQLKKAFPGQDRVPALQPLLWCLLTFPAPCAMTPSFPQLLWIPESFPENTRLLHTLLPLPFPLLPSVWSAYSLPGWLDSFSF